MNLKRIVASAGAITTFIIGSTGSVNAEILEGEGPVQSPAACSDAHLSFLPGAPTEYPQAKQLAIVGIDGPDDRNLLGDIQSAIVERCG